MHRRGGMTLHYIHNALFPKPLAISAYNREDALQKIEVSRDYILTYNMQTVSSAAFQKLELAFLLVGRDAVRTEVFSACDPVCADHLPS